jgi:DNA modification methylase
MAEIIKRKLSTLRKLPGNPRTISAPDLETLKDSLATNPELFDARPIILSDRTGELVIIAGNMRMEAARQIGLKEVPTILLPGLTEAKEREIAIRDNINNGDWDWDLLANQWDDLPLAEWGLRVPTFDMDDELEPTVQEDEEAVAETVSKAAELQQKWQTARGQIWKLGEHRLMCGDCTDDDAIATLMNGKKASACITDPPYNINYGNIKHKKFKQRSIENDDMSSDDFREFCRLFTFQIQKNVTGCVYVFGPPGPDGRIMFSELDATLHCSTTIIWNKDQFTLGRGKYQNKYEPCWFGWVNDGKDFTGDRTLTNVWDIPRPKRSEEHPTMKPVELIATAVEHSTKAQDVVLELFSGSGTTLLACEQLNRRCYAIELAPEYVAVALERWHLLTGKEPELIQE